MRLTRSGYTPNDPPPVCAPPGLEPYAQVWRVIGHEWRRHRPVVTIRGAGLCVACARAWPCPSFEAFDVVLSWLRSYARTETVT